MVLERAVPLTIGRYELIHEIARGGMAVLYLAREVGIEGFEKVVVVKRILPELRANEQYLAMFLDEARIGASLQHGNLPHVYELGCEHGEYFFAMEYLHGADVRRILKTLAAREQLLPLEHVVSIFLGLCAGLHYAHERRAPDGTAMSFVHRDVSPKNVFVTYDGSVKLLDFGIAQAAQRKSETTTGTLKGTLQYMSPEQIRSDNVDRRTDVFAASIMLWEMTTGQSLFIGQGDYAVMSRIIEHDAPAPSTVRPDYPPDLERIVMKGLQRIPGERFQSAEELQVALETFARDHRLPTSPVGLARFMRELYDDDAAAYDNAKQQGTLTTRALAEVATWKQQSAEPGSSPESSERTPKPTRQLEGEVQPRRLARWVPIAALAGAIVAAAAWRMAAPAPPQPETTVRRAPDDAPPIAIATPDATTAPTETAAPTPIIPAVAATAAPSVHRVRREHKRVPAAARPGTRSLTDDDLDAVLPPHK